MIPVEEEERNAVFAVSQMWDVFAFLYSTEYLIDDFLDLETLSLQEVEVELSEGVFYQGLASVIRYVGRKI